MQSSTIPFQIATLIALKASGNPFHAATLVIISKQFTPGPVLTMADLTLSAIPGLNPVAGLVFGTPYVDPFGVVRFNAPSADFVATSVPAEETEYGWALTDVGMTDLYYAEQFQTPIPIQAVGQGFSVEATYPFGG